MTEKYDLVIVGGGIAGGGLATVMARAGKRVLLLEKTAEFRDMVRGEWLAPWGVAEAKRTGLYDVLAGANDHHITYHVGYDGSASNEEAEAGRLKLEGMLPGIPGPLSLGHPHACQALVDAAVAAGASVVRNVSEVTVRTGASPGVSYTTGGVTQTASCRLVVGADGRNSQVRRQLGIELHEDTPHHLFAGLLVEGADDWPADTQVIGTEGDVNYFVFPQGKGRLRLYLGYGFDQKTRFSGEDGSRRFLDVFRWEQIPHMTGVADARIAGPCHSVPNQSTWTDSPLAEEAVLIGDAAGFNDPIIGQGLAISMRDVRIVSDALLATDDWSASTLQPYAEERAERMRRLRFAGNLSSLLASEFGEEAQSRRTRFRLASAANRALGMARIAAMVGPENLPAEAYSEQAWEAVATV